MLRSWRSPTAPCPRTGRARWCRPRVVHGEDAALRWRARAIPPVRTRTAGVVARIGDGRRPGDPGNWRGSCCMRHGHWRETSTYDFGGWARARRSACPDGAVRSRPRRRGMTEVALALQLAPEIGRAHV